GSTPWDPLPVWDLTVSGRLRALLTLPWDVVFGRERIFPYAPWFPLALPLLVPAFRERARLRPAIVFAAAFVAIAPPDGRLLLPALALACMPIGLVLARHVSRPRVIAAIGVVLAGPGFAYAGYRLWRHGPIPATPEQRERYLGARLPLYPAV